MLAELRGLNQAIEPIEVGDEPPNQITIQPVVRVSWGEMRPEAHVFRLDRIEPPSGLNGRAIYVPASH